MSEEIDVSKCRFYYNECNSHILCMGDDDINGICYYKQLQKTDAMLSKLNEELLKIVEPRMSDFTGYDEKTNSFDIVLAIKEIIEELEDKGK